MLVALAKLSLGGGGAATLKVIGFDWPPPGGVFRTEMSSVLPKGPSRAAGRVAVKQVGNGQDTVGAETAMPLCTPLKRTLTLLEKFVPVSWICTGVAGLGWGGVLDGLILVSVGVPARTARVRELLVWVPFTTVIFGVPATVKRDVAIDAVSFVSETCVVVTFVADPFH